MMIAAKADAIGPTSFACNNGIISIGDTVTTVKQKCTVEDKERVENSYTRYWTVAGKFEGGAVLTIKGGKVVCIDEQ